MALNLLAIKALSPDPMRQGIVQMIADSSPVLKHINFIEHSGQSYPYNKLAKLPGVAFRGLNEDFTASASVTNPDVEVLAILGGKIRTDSIAISTKGDQARTNEISRQIQSTGKSFTKTFFKGNTKTAPKGFAGLDQRLGGNQVLEMAQNGAVITAAKVRTLIKRVNGPASEKVLFMNGTNLVNLITNAAATDGYKTAVVQQGETFYFDGVVIEEVETDEAEAEILGFTEAHGTSNVASSAYCVRFGGAVDESHVQGISGLKGEQHVQVKGPIDFGAYVEDLAQMLAGIGLFSGKCAARLEGCLAA